MSELGTTSMACLVFACYFREFTQANLQATFDNAKQLVGAKSPAEMLELWSECASQQFETFAEQAKELAALGQRGATESAEPLSKRLH